MTQHPGLGINVLIKHERQEEIDLYLARLIELGVEWVRLEFDITIPEPAHTGYFISECHKNNIKILGLISNGVEGNLKNLFFPEIDNVPVFYRIPDINVFVTQLISKYGSVISHWEIFNEVNLKRFWVRYPNPGEYVQLLASVASTVKYLQPHAKVVFAGLCGYDDRFDGMPFKKTGYFAEAMQKEAGDFFDIANFHLYGWGSYFSIFGKKPQLEWLTRLLESCVAVSKKYCDKPLWITEFGLSPKWLRLTQTEIAEIYMTIYQQCQAQGLPLFLWTLNDWVDVKREYEPLTPERCFGLLDCNLAPKVVFTQLVRLLNQQEVGVPAKL